MGTSAQRGRMSYVGKWFGFGRDEHYDRGIRAYDRGEYEEALREFGLCIAHANDPATIRLAQFYASESHVQLGHIALKAGDPERAITHFETALQAHPNYPDLHLHLSLAHKAAGHAAEREKHLRRAIELNPGYAGAIVHEAALLYEQGECEKAFSRAQHAIELDPALSSIRYRSALQAHEAGDGPAAIQHLLAMADPDADETNGELARADSYARSRQWEDAALSYAKCLQNVPAYPDVRCRFAQVLLELDRVEEAAQQFGVALDLNPRYADAFAGLGVAYRRMGKHAEAKKAFRKATEIDPYHGVARRELERLS